MTDDKPDAARCAQPTETPKTKTHSRPNGRNQAHDVFKRINMHDGDQTVCWEWTGTYAVDPRGHRRPRWKINGKTAYVSRTVYEQYYGVQLKHADKVLHSCDNSECCNPFHMRLGTQLANVRDMLDRERQGLKNWVVKKIMQYLEADAPTRYIADKMRADHQITLDESVIRRIRLRKIYRSIEWPWGDAYAAAHAAKVASKNEAAIIASTADGGKDATSDND